MKSLKYFLLLSIATFPFKGMSAEDDKRHLRHVPSFGAFSYSPGKEEKNKVYETLKNRASELGLSTDGGIGVLKSRIRAFESLITEESHTRFGSPSYPPEPFAAPSYRPAATFEGPSYPEAATFAAPSYPPAAPFRGPSYPQAVPFRGPSYHPAAPFAARSYPQAAPFAAPSYPSGKEKESHQPRERLLELEERLTSKQLAFKTSRGGEKLGSVPEKGGAFYASGGSNFKGRRKDYPVRMEEKRLRSLEYALSIGCSVDEDAPEDVIQKAIEERKEERKREAVEARKAASEERKEERKREAAEVRKEARKAANEEKYIADLKREARELGLEVSDWFTKDRLKEEIASKKKEEWETRTREGARKEGIPGADYESVESLSEQLKDIRNKRREERQSSWQRTRREREEAEIEARPKGREKEREDYWARVNPSQSREEIRNWLSLCDSSDPSDNTNCY